MRVVLSIGNVIVIGLTSFLFIIGLTHLFKFGQTAPVVGPVFKGADEAWRNTVAA